MPVLYYALAVFANQYATFTTEASILWPSNSVLLAALLIQGRRDYFWLIGGAILAEIAGDTAFISFHEALAYGVGNAIEVSVALVLLKQWRFDRKFSSLDDLLKFIVAALIIAALLGAVIGAFLHSYFKVAESGFLENMRLLWFGDALGLMIFTPLWLSLWPFTHHTKAHQSSSVTNSYDWWVGLAASALLGIFIGSRSGAFLGVHVGPTLLLPFVVYAGARFGLRGASISTIAATVITVLMMGHGFNPFGNLTTREAVIQAQEFLFIMSLVALGSGSLFSKLKVQQDELEKANIKLSELNQNLEGRVAERNAELMLANAQLESEMKERERTARELQAANQELQRLAGIDGLTQIANRRTFDAYLEVEWKRSIREGSTLSLILFDIDFFKRYNDHYGHPTGDTCLIQIATATMEAVKRPADLVARYGGEEFAVILPDTDRVGALTVMRQIWTAIQEKAIEHEYSDVCGVVTISAGVATHVARGQETTEYLLNLADKALYRAKSQGRNCFVFEPVEQEPEEKLSGAR